MAKITVHGGPSNRHDPQPIAPPEPVVWTVPAAELEDAVVSDVLELAETPAREPAREELVIVDDPAGATAAGREAVLDWWTAVQDEGGEPSSVGNNSATSTASTPRKSAPRKATRPQPAPTTENP